MLAVQPICMESQKTARCQTYCLGNLLSFWPCECGQKHSASWAHPLQYLLSLRSPGLSFLLLCMASIPSDRDFSHLLSWLGLFASAVCPSSRHNAKATDAQDGGWRPGHGEGYAWMYQQALDIPMALFISLKSHLCTWDFSTRPSWE